MAPAVASSSRRSVCLLWIICVVFLHSSLDAVTASHVLTGFFQGHCQDPNPNPCHHICHDIVGAQGYICACREGFRLDRDGSSCIEHHHPHENLIQDDQASAHNLPALDGNQILALDPSTLASSPKTQAGAVPAKPNASQGAKSPQTRDQDQDSQQTKNLPDDGISRVSLGEPVVKITTVDLKKDVRDPLQSLNVVEGGEHPLDPAEHPGAGGPVLEAAEGGETEAMGADHGLERMEYRVTCGGVECLNNGSCLVEGYHARCNCPLGFLGDRCERAVDVRFPRFHGTGYLALPVLKDGYKEFWVAVEFRPEAKNGLLLFSAEEEDARADFFSIAIVNGVLEFRFDCGTGPAVLRSRREVILGQWNRVFVRRSENLGTLQLNDEAEVNGSSQGAFSRITLRLHLYLGGYSNMSAIVTRSGTHKAFVGCIQEVVINSHKYDLRPSGLVGESIHGVNVGECSEGLCDNIICLNDGVCKAKSADKHICLCPLGTSGDFCEKTEQLHIPQFSGHSHLQFAGLGRTALSYTEIETVFKPTAGDGVLLYNGYTQDRKGDFIMLALRDGYVEFRFDLGTGPAVLRSESRVALGTWHMVRASRTGLQGLLEVDDQLRVEGESRGAFTQLTLLQELYLGGMHDFDHTSRYANISSSFQGCIQKVVINKRPLRLLGDAKGGVNVEPCQHPCGGEPCLHGGECVPHKDVYTCYCPLGFTNTNCEDRLTRLPNTPMFSGESFLMYTDRQVIKRVVGNKVDIQLHLKPQSRSGLLLWSGPDHMTSTSDFIALGFVDGSLQLRYNLGSGEAVIAFNGSQLFDGQWHFVRAQRDKQDAYLEIDGSEIVEGSAPGSYTVLNTNNILYLGGMPDVTESTMGKFTSGFQGCIRDLTLATELAVKLLAQAQSGRNVLPCS